MKKLHEQIRAQIAKVQFVLPSSSQQTQEAKDISTWRFSLDSFEKRNIFVQTENQTNAPS